MKDATVKDSAVKYPAVKYAVVQLPSTSDVALDYGGAFVPSLRHPFYAFLGARPFLAQHTAEEHAALKKWARGRSTIVEIGVAEGVSALALREGMSADATLHLIDPFHLSRVPALNFVKRSAHRAVATCPRGKVVWIEQFSFDCAKKWREPIDLLLIDGDHSERGVRRDWDDWSGFVKPGGIVIFHDARLFQGGWTTPEYGPIRLVDNLFRTQRIPGWSIVEELHSLVVVLKQC
jgi:predicted O-methyltransferase YrrM